MTKKIKEKKIDLQKIEAHPYLHVQDRNMESIKSLADDYEKLREIYNLLKKNKYEAIIKDEDNEFTEFNLEDINFNGDNKYKIDFLFRNVLIDSISKQMQDNYDEIKQWVENNKPDFFPK